MSTTSTSSKTGLDLERIRQSVSSMLKLQRRSLHLHGGNTSLTLEGWFWDYYEQEASRHARQTWRDIVRMVDTYRPAGVRSTSAWLRLWAYHRVRALLHEAKQRTQPNNAAAVSVSTPIQIAEAHSFAPSERNEIG